MLGFAAFVLLFLGLPALFLVLQEKELERRIQEDQELYEEQKRNIEEQRNGASDG